jgi:hypothetical protein
MIWTVEEIKSMSEFSSMDDTTVRMLLDATEDLIRHYTNNNFQNRSVQWKTGIINGLLQFVSPYIKVGNTVEITKGLNAGLYIIQSISEEGIAKLDKSLFDDTDVIVTQIVYPYSVKKGALDLFRYEVTSRDRVGVKQESLSRHSVTYFDQDKDNTAMGYPISLLGFLRPFRKARF